MPLALSSDIECGTRTDTESQSAKLLSMGDEAVDQDKSKSQGSRVAIYQFAKRWVVYLLRLESLILLLLALYAGISALVREVTSLSGVMGEILFAIVGALGLYFASLSYKDGRSFGRAPAVLANLIALGVSYFMYAGNAIWSAIPLSILAATTLALALLAAQEI